MGTAGCSRRGLETKPIDPYLNVAHGGIHFVDAPVGNLEAWGLTWRMNMSIIAYLRQSGIGTTSELIAAMRNPQDKATLVAWAREEMTRAGIPIEEAA